MRNGNPKFYKLLEEMGETHNRKSHDYASNDNPMGNYHFAGHVACLFGHSPEDAGFVGRIAEKIYRLANLEGSGKEPTNESIADTERDIAVITLLWMTDRRDRREKPNPLETELFDLIKLMPDSQTTKIIDFILELRKSREMHKHESQAIEQPAYGFHGAEQAKDKTDNITSVRASMKIIELESELLPNHRRDMIDYLTEREKADKQRRQGK